MGSELYLDTARLGRMCRGARKAEQDFCWLVSQLGSSLYFERFLDRGFTTLPSRLRHRLGGLSCWHGVQAISDAFGEFVQQPAGCPTFFFSESSALIRFALANLLDATKRVLVTDLCWPPYLSLLGTVANERGQRLTVAPIRDLISNHGTESDVVEAISRAYFRDGCDGVFISDISFRGVMLPIQLLMETLTPDFSVVDGAQAMGQRPVDIAALNCDLYLAGTQKWMGAYHPLRIAICGRSEAADRLVTAAARLRGDGLFQFTERLKTRSSSSFGQTVNLSPLLCAAGALASAGKSSRDRKWHRRQENAHLFRRWVTTEAWQPAKISQAMQSGIALFTPTSSKQPDVIRLRRSLAKHTLAATAYTDGSVRFSMPSWHLSLQHLTAIRRALESASN